MFQNAFEKLELADVATILDRVNPELDGLEFDPVEAVIMAQDISFYPGCRFLDIADHSVNPPVQRYIVYSDDKVVVLDFTNEPIYKLNADVPVLLTEDTVADYVRFFFSYVRGRYGRFLICENVDDIRWKDEPPPAARKAVGKMLEPITLKNIGADGTFLLEACMVFKDSLFKSDINVKSNGLVSLTDEELLIEDMPVLDDIFGQ